MREWKWYQQRIEAYAYFTGEVQGILRLAQINQRFGHSSEHDETISKLEQAMKRLKEKQDAQDQEEYLRQQKEEQDANAV